MHPSGGQMYGDTFVFFVVLLVPVVAPIELDVAAPIGCGVAALTRGAASKRTHRLRNVFIAVDQTRKKQTNVNSEI